MAKKVEFSLETVKKYVFWACIPIGLIFPIFTTISAVGNITKAFNDRKGVLESTKKATETIAADRVHPNEITIADIKNCDKELRGRVIQAWQILEKDQRERNLWPEDVGEPFRKEVAKLKFTDEISLNARERYLNFVNNYLPSLEVYVDRRRVQHKDTNTGEWKEMVAEQKISAGGGMDGGTGGSSEMNITGAHEQTLPRGPNGEEIYRYVGTVDWPNPETREVTASWQKILKSNEIWFAQEELWVYRALLSVVKESNAGATGPHNSVIKKIENLLIGQSASAMVQARSSIRFGMSGTGASTDLSSSSMDSGGATAGPTVARTEADVITIKKNNRYVDDKAKPLAATEESQFKQFKRMPICLRLIVDQRKIPEILVNCANCSMPIDVLWVRFNPAAVKPFDLSAYDAAVGAAAAGAAGGDTGSDSSGGGMSSGGGGYGGGEGGGSANSDVQIRIDSHVGGGVYGTNAIPIEIYGCINIFNPVEHGGLQLEDSENAETPAASATPAAAASE